MKKKMQETDIEQTSMRTNLQITRILLTVNKHGLGIKTCQRFKGKDERKRRYREYQQRNKNF